ncbi:hypothetical protein Tco_0695416 [Tanacetum coccineum]
MRTRSSLEYTIPRRRNRRRSRQQQEAIPLIPDPIPMADDRPMAEQLQAPTGGFESAIVVPPINAQNFELKSSLINLVQNRIFRGGNDEEPHAHIRHFESITNNQSNTIPNRGKNAKGLPLLSGIVLDGPLPPMPPPYVNPDNEKAKEMRYKDKEQPPPKVHKYRNSSKP